MATEVKKKFSSKLRSKYRLVILDDSNFEEKLSLRLSRLNVFVVVGFGSLYIIAATIVLIALTPLREYIPGYSSTEVKRTSINTALKLDSLEEQFVYLDRYLHNLKRVLNDELEPDSVYTNIGSAAVEVGSLGISPQDSLLRAQVEAEEMYNLNIVFERDALAGFAFFKPVNGKLTRGFNLDRKQIDIQIETLGTESVKACLNGTVLLSEFTGSGYLIMIQHESNLVSVYKNVNSTLKRSGDLVRSGEVIGLLGMQVAQDIFAFELWHQGNPVNPLNFINY